MLSGEGNAGERWKTTTGLISEKSNFARAAHFFCTFLCRCFARLLTTLNFQKLLIASRFMEEMSNAFSFTFFSLPLIFTLYCWLLAFLILSPPLQNFHVVQQKCLLCILSLPLDLCRPFSRWASLACRPLSLFLCLSPALYSKFVDMTINTLDKTDTETTYRFPLSSLLTL